MDTMHTYRVLDVPIFRPIGDKFVKLALEVLFLFLV